MNSHFPFCSLLPTTHLLTHTYPYLQQTHNGILLAYGLEIIEEWYESFGAHYPELQIVFFYLQNVKKMKFPEMRKEREKKRKEALRQKVCIFLFSFFFLFSLFGHTFRKSKPKTCETKLIKFFKSIPNSKTASKNCLNQQLSFLIFMTAYF